MDTTVKAMRWTLPDSAIRGMQHNEDGTVSVQAELYRPDKIGRFHITEAFVEATFDRWVVDLVDSHDADLDANPTHIGGRTAPLEIEKGTKATLATLKTHGGPTGQQMAALLRLHDESVKAGGPPIVTLSIGAHDVVFAKDEGPGMTEPPWNVVDGKPDHVMLVRAGYQAQENAGVRVAATLEAALEEAAESLIAAASDSEQMSDDSPELIQLRTDLKASIESATKANADRDAAVKAQGEVQAKLDVLNKQTDDAERTRLVDEITGIYSDLDEEAPASSDWDLERTRAEHTNALIAYREKAPAKLGVKGGPVPPKPDEDDSSDRPKDFSVSGKGDTA